MSATLKNQRRPFQALDSLLRLRELENQRAQVKLQQHQMRIGLLKQELAGLKKRRASVIRRGGAHVLRERLLLDALMKLSLEKGRELERLETAAAPLFDDYRLARSQRDAVASLRERKRLERELLWRRKTEQTAVDSAAARQDQERHQLQEDIACED